MNFDVAEMLVELADNGVKIYLSGGGLKVSAPDNKLSQSDRAKLKDHKESILTFFEKKGIQSNSQLGYLSFQQTRLWLIDRIEPNNTQYNMPGMLRIEGALNEYALKESIKSIVNRHSVLRTVYHEHEGNPYQQVKKPIVDDIVISIDISGLGAGEQEEAIRDFGRREVDTPFDLSEDLMLRASLVKQDREKFVLLITMHHIAADAWSVDTVLRELAVLYTAYERDLTGPLPEPEIQYIDYAHWQRQWLKNDVYKKQLEHWTSRLQGIPQVHSVPLDNPRPAAQSYRGEFYQHLVDRALRRDVDRFAQRQGVTLFMVLQTAFACLLSRYSGKMDIVMGVPVANRQQPELAKLVGFFANTLALRTDLSGDPLFSELLHKNKENLLNDYEYQQLPFEKLVDELHAERNLSHSPIFQILFSLRSNKQQTLELPGLDTCITSPGETAAKFDLTLEVIDDEGGLFFRWEYVTDLFKRDTVQRMAEHFIVLLRGAIERPQTPVSALPLMTQTERRLLTEWNENSKLYPKEQCVHELFEIQVERTPDSAAVWFNNTNSSYGELNAKSNRLARYLIAHGVKSDVLVGLHVERSLDMVVGVLAILKAGGAYVPLDPTYPTARLEYMLNDSGVKIVLSQEHLREKMTFDGRHVVNLDDEGVLKALEGYSAANTDKSLTGLKSSDLAYVIYTSGSTGRPKGVMIEHASLTNFLCSMTGVPGICAEDALLAVTSTSFDIHTLELYLPLINGARVVIATADDAMSAENLSSLMLQYGISIMQATPSTWKMLLTGGWQAKSPLKVLCGGEAWNVSLKNELLCQANIELWNMYGPTETTVWSSVKRVTAQDSGVRLGPPIANTQLYVLDENRELCPLGVPGELYIGGDGLARGYLNRQELTQTRFVDNPFSDRAGGRMYRTGDLVRRLADGDLQFMGRIDQQVKIRGFRVELEEIENQLSSYPGVRSAVVIVREDEPDNRCLVAYIASDAETGSDAETIDTLRERLQSTLPGYMVPSAFVLLDELPLTPNGKVDKNSLPAPERLSSDADYVAPSTDSERTLAAVWAQLFSIDIERVSATANFFTLGGDSLLATRMTSRAARVGLRLTVKQLFEYQTIRSLARQIVNTGSLEEPALPDNAGSSPVDTGPVVGDMPLTIDQTAFLDSGFDMPHWGIILYSYELAEAFDPVILGEAVNALLVHHDAMRARFVQESGVWRQSICEPRRHELISVVDLSHLENDTVEQTVNDIACDLLKSFDLSAGPLLKVVQIDLGAGRPGRLLFAIHHLICDGLSLQIIGEDLAMAYQQLLANQPVELPEKTTSVNDWIAKLEDYANSNELKEEAQHWLNLPWDEMATLPVDFPGGEYKRYVGSQTEIASELSEKETFRIVNDLPSYYGVSTFDAIAAALVATLSAWMQCDKVLLCIHDSGRNVLPDMQDTDLSRTVGWLSYRRVVVLQKPETDDFSGLLESVSRQLRTRPNQGSGFGILSTYCKDDALREKLRTSTVPKIWLNYTGVHIQEKDGSWQLPEVTLDKFRWTSPDDGEIRNIHMPLVHPDNQEAWYILLNSGIRDNRFHMNWRYSENLYRSETIEGLSNNYMTLLREMAAFPG